MEQDGGNGEENDELAQLKAEAEELRAQIQDARNAAADATLADFVEKANIAPCTNVQMKSRRVLRAHWGKIYAVHWNADSRHLVSAAQDGKMIVWDGYTGNKRALIPLRSQWVMSCAYAPSGNLLAVGGLDNTCTVYSIKNREKRVHRELRGHGAYLSGCRFIDDNQLVSCSGDKTCCLWDVEAGQKLTTFQQVYRDGSAVLCLALAPDLRTFVAGDTENQARLWDLRDGQCKRTFYMDDNCNGVCFFPSGQQLVTASDDCSCRLFDLRSDNELGFYAREDVACSVSSVAFSRSGRIIFSGCDDSTISIWDTLRQELIGVLQGHENKVSSVGVTDDGKALVSASWDTTVKIWN